MGERRAGGREAQKLHPRFLEATKTEFGLQRQMAARKRNQRERERGKRVPYLGDTRGISAGTLKRGTAAAWDGYLNFVSAADNE